MKSENTIMSQLTGFKRFDNNAQFIIISTIVINGFYKGKHSNPLRLL